MIDEKRVRKSNTLIARLKYLPTSRELLIASLHLKAKVGFEEKREEQINALKEELKEYNKTNQPIIICGDFNDEPKSNSITKKKLLKYRF